MAQEEKGNKYVVGEIAVQTEQVIYLDDNKDEQYTVMSALCKILNEIKEIKKLL